MATMQPIVRAFGYVRISKETADTTSPQRQRQAIQRLCRERGWKLLEVFEDIDRSAYNGKHRPAFASMMSRLAETDAIVFWTLSRLSRSAIQSGEIARATKEAGVHLVATDMTIDTASAGGKFVYQVLAAAAEMESDTISERSRAMTAYKRSREEWLGRVPYGWRRAGKGIEPDPAQVRILRKAAQAYVDGASFHALAAEFGFAQAASLRRILRSDRTAQVLDPELADQLATSLADRTMVRVPASGQSLLGGIAVCSICGAGLGASSTRSSRPGWLGQYRCQRAGHVGVARGWLDAFVAGAVIEAVDTGKLVEAIRRREKRGQTRKASDIEARIEVLDDQFDGGQVSQARYRERRGRLLDLLADAREQERDSGFALPEEFARNLRERWDDFTTSERRRIVSAVLERVEIAPFDGTRKGRPRSGVDRDRVRLVWRT
jgi:DNA invertase Pin-like site-specific DNA recombinase